MKTVNTLSLPGLLKSLGFVDMTGVEILEGGDVVKIIDANSTMFRGRWCRQDCYTMLVDLAGTVYLRYGSDDITKGEAFQQVVGELSCQKHDDDPMLSWVLPGDCQYYNFEQVWSRTLSLTQ